MGIKVLTSNSLIRFKTKKTIIILIIINSKKYLGNCDKTELYKLLIPLW